MASCQKLGIILVINGFKNWFYQKMSITTNMLLHWYSSIKKIQKDSDDFWNWKLTLKVKFCYFLTAPHYSNFQNLVISFEYGWFLAKNLSNFVSLPWKLHNRECHNFRHNKLPLYYINARAPSHVLTRFSFDFPFFRCLASFGLIFL